MANIINKTEFKTILSRLKSFNLDVDFENFKPSSINCLMNKLNISNDSTNEFASSLAVFWTLKYDQRLKSFEFQESELKKKYYDLLDGLSNEEKSGIEPVLEHYNSEVLSIILDESAPFMVSNFTKMEAGSASIEQGAQRKMPYLY